MPWLQIFVMILSYLASRKSGATGTQAALIAAGAGLATHYAVKYTEFGQENLAPINGAIDSFFGISSGTITDGTVTDSEGQVITGPAGTTPVKQPDGSIVWVPNTSQSWYSSAAGVLKDWGPLGTVGVVAGVSAATSLDNKLWIWLAIGAGVLLLMR